MVAREERLHPVSLLQSLLIFAGPFVIWVWRDPWSFVELREQKGFIRRKSSFSVAELSGGEVRRLLIWN